MKKTLSPNFTSGMNSFLPQQIPLAASPLLSHSAVFCSLPIRGSLLFLVFNTLLIILFSVEVHAAPDNFIRGDVSSSAEQIAEPLKAFGYASKNAQIADLHYHEGKLYLAHGTSSNGSVKEILYVDLSTNESGREGIGIFNEEQITRIRSWGSDLYVHSYDGLVGPRYYYKPLGQDWQARAVNGAGDHMRDTIFFDDTIWVTYSADVFPNMRRAPITNPSGAFTQVNQPVPSGWSGSILMNTFFEFQGKLFATSGDRANYSIYYDPAAPAAGWQVAKSNYIDVIGSSNEHSPDSLFFRPLIVDPVEINGFLLFDGFHAFPGSSTHRGLFATRDFLGGPATKVVLPGIPADQEIRYVYPIWREGRLFAVSMANPYVTGQKLTKVWIHQAVNLDLLDEPDGWQALASFSIAAFLGSSNDLHNHSPLEYVDGAFYFPESYASTQNSNTVETGAGSIWRIPVEPLPSTLSATPEDIQLSHDAIMENAAIGSVVGTLTTTDPDAGDSHTYSLVSGDTVDFSIVGNELRTAAVFDYETKSSYAITLRSTDASGLFVEKAFTIVVTPASEDSLTGADAFGSITFGDDDLPISGQDGSNGSPSNLSISSDRSSATLTGNTWKYFPLSYTVTADTVLEVTVDAANVGEIIGIILDNDTNATTGRRAFLFGGSQYGEGAFDTWSWKMTPRLSSGESATYTIPVGDHFTGSVSYLGLIADDDVSPHTIDVTFSNLRLYEPTPYDVWSNTVDWGLVPLDLRDPDDDANGNGYSNQLMRALGGDPAAPGSRPEIFFTLETQPDGSIVLKQSYLKNAPEMIYQFMWSTELDHWYDSDVSAEQFDASKGLHFQTWTVPPDTDKAFGRLKISE
ncbi:MAG: cadherin repeat domain-containing protein [Kiritimatiellia bacterium]